MIDHTTLWETSAPPPNATIIAAGPINKQPATRCYRLVLRDMGDEGYVVHLQFFRLNLGRLSHDSYGSGDYFKRNQLVKATECFADRLKQDAGHYDSILEQRNGTNDRREQVMLLPGSTGSDHRDL